MAAVRAVRAVAALLSADDLQETGKLGVMTWVFRRKMRPKGCPENHLRYSGAVERIRCGAFRDFVNASCFGWTSFLFSSDFGMAFGQTYWHL
jgi:hypothetical protein